MEKAAISDCTNMPFPLIRNSVKWRRKPQGKGKSNKTRCLITEADETECLSQRQADFAIIRFRSHEISPIFLETKALKPFQGKPLASTTETAWNVILNSPREDGPVRLH